jgi:hypothetical protein
MSFIIINMARTTGYNISDPRWRGVCPEVNGRI